MKSPEDDCDKNLFAEEVNAHFFFQRALHWWVVSEFDVQS